MNFLWDFDGTIFDTYPSYTKLFREVTGNRIPEEEVRSQLKVSFGHAFSYFKLTEEESARMRREVRLIGVDAFKLFPGIEEVLKMADTNVIMTHKEKEDVQKVLEHHGLYHYFTEIVGQEDGFPRKPDPQAYRYLHDKYRIDLAIGDRALDLEPARILGIRTLSFQNRNSDADYYLDDYRDFEKKVWPLLEK
ncbi:phosphoglycolate phosphatase [Bacillus sp. FJAT-27225]|uniref:HAD-IA family hydrolase n=1 Tax=Bacillus sp. FJAT-27225 TaxID=1743144 RepID=UPI00080C2E82|nr:HAD-IA family hydrolase [Bacillus sp. FJAT-27225]OCA81549.1 phosphoglycolate phosphatase [Bacillus sp. FJAT-27225]